MQRKEKQSPKDMAVIEKASELMRGCFEISDDDIPTAAFGTELLGGMALTIYQNLIRADECGMASDEARQERQFYQREAIVGCRVLIGVLETAAFIPETVDIHKKTEEVLCMTASWKNKERRQAALQGGA